MASMNQPNAGFNFAPSIFLDKYIPINIPVQDATTIEARNVQLIFVSMLPPVNPIKEFTAIISNEVPMAIFIGILDSKAKAGIIKKPPPAPTIPAIKPTAAPSSNSIG